MSVTFHEVASVADVAPDSAIAVRIGDDDVAVFNLNGEFFALDDVCTHGAALLHEGYVEGDVIECPQHAGSFDIRSGKAVAYPCVVDAKSYPVKVDGDKILVGIEG